MVARPSFIQAPTYWQLRAIYDLVRLSRNLVAGRYGDLLPPELAIEFRAANCVCDRQFELPKNLDAFERDLEVLSEVVRSKVELNRSESSQ